MPPNSGAARLLHAFGSTVEGLDNTTASLKDERSGATRARLGTLTDEVGADVDNNSPRARQLKRTLARRTSAKERQTLYEERAKLVLQEFAGRLSAEETGRLGAVSWILEQLEDAELGPSLDSLERVAELIESHGRDLAKFAGEVRAARPQNKRFFPSNTVNRR